MLSTTLMLCLAHASLLSPADVQFVQDSPPPLVSPPSAPSAAPASRQLLLAELETLRAKPAPSFAGGIVLIAVGVPLLAAGLVFGIYGIAFATAGAGSLVGALGVTFLLIAAVLTVPAVICIAVGIPVLASSLSARKERNRQIRALEEQLQATPDAQPPNAPPPPPPSVRIEQPRLLLATF